MIYNNCQVIKMLERLGLMGIQRNKLTKPKYRTLKRNRG